ncbi:MAG: RdgB/HAM1 family non-canonical purine NTP pyrophosphatase [Synergistaceae bacterium]|nr:RdgB/HAM1 family non-canonical purine NTP pyrophosphatase [Synergistaceae bacterium]
MFSKLLIATGNKGKYKEFVDIIRETGGQVFAEQIIFAPEISRLVVEETGKTYAENAMLKARAWAERSGLPCLADDSGLEVNALDGAPGLFSARIIHGNDTDKASWLLSQLEGNSNRKARFSAALCLCVPDKFTLISEGYCYGNIAQSPRGANGFGYDPVFVPEGFNQTFAELPPDVKNKISHRTNAFKKIFTVLMKGG